jgi:hypothetical protein
MASEQKLSSELLRRGHTTWGTPHVRTMRLRRLSFYEQRTQSIRKSLDNLLDHYVGLFVAGKDARFVRSEILAHDRILKTDSVIVRHR